MWEVLEDGQAVFHATAPDANGDAYSRCGVPQVPHDGAKRAEGGRVNIRSILRVIFLIALFQSLGACRRKQESDQGDQIAPQIFYWPDGGCVKRDDTKGDVEK